MNFLFWDIRVFKDGELRKRAAAASQSLAAAVKETNPKLDGFFDKTNEVVRTFNHQHIDFGDSYYRLKFAYQPVELPKDFLWNCGFLKAENNGFNRPAKDVIRLAERAEEYHDFVAKHNKKLFDFAGYDGNMRALLRTIEDVHLRALSTYVNSGQAGGSPIGVNPIITDLNNTRDLYILRQSEFSGLAKDLANLKLR